MRIVDGEVQVGDVLTYDVRTMAGYGWGYLATATVLAVKGDRVRIEYRRVLGPARGDGKLVRRWVARQFLYKRT